VNVGPTPSAKLDSLDGSRYAIVSTCNVEQKRAAVPGDLIK
jgi:hypothetical protein